jgi:TldD protein
MEQRGLKYMAGKVALLLVIFIAQPLLAEDSLLKILQEELDLEFTALQEEKIPPYYIEYRVSDITVHSVGASFGSLTKSGSTRKRMVNVVVKVGDYSFDNTHVYQDEEAASAYNYNFSALLPLENDETAIKQVLWWNTNRAYINALSVFSSIKDTDNEKFKKNSKRLPDFSKEGPSVFYEGPIDPLQFDKKLWESRVKQLSGSFLYDTSILSANAAMNFVVERKYFVSSEKSSVVQNLSYTQLQVNAQVHNNDGIVVPLLKSYVAKNPDGLTAFGNILDDVENLKSTLEAFKSCPTAEPYTGPAILSSAAAGVFFHEIFGHRIEGHRLKDETDGHTFKDKVGEKVLPKTFNVYFDPREEGFGGTDLIGHYLYDDEGVKAGKVNVVESGVLKNFLMSRTPVEGHPNSNGHGRSQTGELPVARQSNMFIESSKPLDDDALRKKLVKACKSQNLPYGYFFKTVYGGFTYTTRYMPNVFNIFPLEVYRVYVDGRPDELVNGVELIGTPLAMFAEIEAAGKDYNVFNGFCGAESGMVPVSTIAPSIFVNKIETQSKPNNYVNPPILKMPGLSEKTTK